MFSEEHYSVEMNKTKNLLLAVDDHRDVGQDPAATGWLEASG